MLYPKENETRTLSDLSGMWAFKCEFNDNSVDVKEKLKETTRIAVPASVNDQVVDEKIRNHIGNFWYEKEFTVPEILFDRRIILRFGSVSHTATVYINGEYVGEHEGGFTPFEFEINKYIIKGQNNLKVCVSNILNHTTLPVGAYSEVNGVKKVEPQFDFFNYFGIHRPVKIYTTDYTYIKDIKIDYNVKGKETKVLPEIETKGNYDYLKCEIFDEDGILVDSSETEYSELFIEETERWEPLNSYLYTLKVSIIKDNQIVDTYTEEFGVRTIEIKDNKLLVNDKPIYLSGFGKHEDFPIIGKGLNEPVFNLDLNVMESMGANSFRTSHYPYSEEAMYQADRKGFLVINEVAGVGLYSRFQADVTLNTQDTNTWNNIDTFETHKVAIEELIKRDKNHPSVISWAIANEPASHQKGAREYFKPLIELTRELDFQKRPIVIPNIVNATPELDEVSDLVDILCINRYYGWYIDHGDLKTAIPKLIQELKRWHEKYPDKPIMFSEFGVDTISGLHSMYSDPYTEEFQIEFYQETFAILDKFDYIIGEHLWNFADFATAHNIRRINGNKKGVFTRDRKPKSIVPYLKNRWLNKN